MFKDKLNKLGFLFILLIAIFGSGHAALAQGEGQAVKNGVTLDPAKLAVWEIATKPSTSIYAGYPPADGFKVSEGHNAWFPYNSYKDAIAGACSTAAERMEKDGYTSVQVNNKPFDSATCLQLPTFGTAPAGNTAKSAANQAKAASSNAKAADVLHKYELITGDIRGIPATCEYIVSQPDKPLPAFTAVGIVSGLQTFYATDAMYQQELDKRLALANGGGPCSPITEDQLPN